MAKRRRNSALLEQAQAETQLRYGGQARGLKALLDSAKADLVAGVQAEKSAAAGLSAAVKAAGPEIVRAYQTAGLTQANAESDIRSALGAGAEGSTALREAQLAKSRLAASLADSKVEITNRGVDAQQARVYGVQQRQRAYDADRGKVLQEQSDLEDEAGLYAATTFRGLKDAKAKFGLEKRKVRLDINEAQEQRRSNRVDEDLAGRTLDETQRHNQAAEEQDRREEARRRREEAGGKSKFTPSQLQDARAMWDKAKLYAEALVKSDKDEVRKAGEKAWVRNMTGRGIDAVIAQGAIEFVKVGGVKPPTRRRIQRDYGLAPKVRPDWESRKGDRVPPVLEPLIGTG
jgi:hypothetical protein